MGYALTVDGSLRDEVVCEVELMDEVSSLVIEEVVTSPFSVLSACAELAF